MATENILYTDGHHVTVTESIFQVKKNRYRLEGITDHGFHIIKPNRIPVIVISIFGLLAIGLGIMKFNIPIDYSVNVYSYKLFTNDLMLLGGISLVIIGILISTLLKVRYGVRISTAEGDKNVVVSERKEYVSMIVGALDQADQSQRQRLQY